jgi:hypothetical protein
MSDTCERSAAADGWYQWFGAGPWFHAFPWDDSHWRPPYIIGTALDVCLLQGLETGDTTL